MIKRIIPMVLVLTALMSAFCSCSGDGYVMEYGKTGVTEGMYRYMYASQKQYYLDTYSDILDTEEFWLSEAVDSMTYAEYIDSQIRESIRDFIISAELFDGRGNKIDDTGAEQIDAVYKMAVDHFGSEKALETALSKLGLSLKELKKVYQIQYKFERMLYDSGIAQADDDSREKYYNERYACVKIIYIATEKGYKLDDSGDKIINSDGYYEMYELSKGEKEKKKSRAAAIEEMLNNGEAVFDELYTDQTVNELDIQYYPNGFYICADAPYETGLVAVADVAFSLEVGEQTRVRDENGEYIVKRYELPLKAYDDENDYVQFASLDEMSARYKFRELMDQLLPGLVQSNETVEKYSVTNVDAVTY